MSHPWLTAYIDPGTGSMLFTILVGLIGAAAWSFKAFFMKWKVRLAGGQVKEDAGQLPLVIFSDSKRYFFVFEPVCRELAGRGIPIAYLTGSEDDPAFSCDIPGLTAEYIGTGDAMFARLNRLNAAVVLSTTPGLDVYQWKRSPRVKAYVHMLHAANEVTLYRMFGLDYYDAVLLSGEYQVEQIRALEALRNLPAKELAITGLPYLDVMAERVRAAGARPAHERTVLLAPSWGPSAIFAVHGSTILEKLLETGYRVIVRPHPQSFTAEAKMLEKLMADFPDSDRLSWNRDTDNFNALREADILISDFSGVIFEFALAHDKPVIYTDPDFDLAPYDAWWLKDMPLWTVSALPRIGQRLDADSLQNLKGLIDQCLDDPRYAAGRREVREETWVPAGEGTLRTADWLEAKIHELTRKEADAS